MSDRESQQASIDASEFSLPAENGSREVENDPPPLGRAEESVSDAGVAARTVSLPPSAEATGRGRSRGHEEECFPV